MKKRISLCMIVAVCLLGVCACSDKQKVTRVQSSDERLAQKEKEAEEKKKLRSNDFTGLILDGHDVLKADFGMNFDELKATDPDADWKEYDSDSNLFEEYRFAYCRSNIAGYDISVQHYMYYGICNAATVIFDKYSLTEEEAKKLYADLKEYYTKKFGVNPELDESESGGLYARYELEDRIVSIWSYETEVELTIVEPQ